STHAKSLLSVSLRRTLPLASRRFSSARPTCWLSRTSWRVESIFAKNTCRISRRLLTLLKNKRDSGSTEWCKGKTGRRVKHPPTLRRGKVAHANCVNGSGRRLGPTQVSEGANPVQQEPSALAWQVSGGHDSTGWNSHPRAAANRARHQKG